jgi:hypothetical protein
VTIDLVRLLNLLKEVNETGELGGKRFDNRWSPILLEDGSTGSDWVEDMEMRKRDLYLLYARSQSLLSFEVTAHSKSEREDYLGSVVSITPAGLTFLEAKSEGWWEIQLRALGANVVTIVVSVIIALVSAWMLRMVGLRP